ncbi:malonyl-CoA synthase [Roseateles aquatilis]|uniref:Malonyl-CoA synthase n=1 Tax=Roseateles aquatilis TaxID=431061 RepID=A0A246J2V4_9BURK|nr:malonyl-CoA synthase [Roseateles aquatilis]OWQ86926.1 malonyl-CoA synthase [Roseateles aquatilis]
MEMNANLFVALRANFAEDLDACAIEVADGEAGAGAGQRYSWRDIDRATAMIANLLDSLDLPAGSRVAVQTEKSVEALLLYLAVLRAGYVYLPLNTAYQAAELSYFIDNAEPAVVVCAGRNFGWVSKLAFQAKVPWVFTLDEDRRGTLLDRAVQMSDRHQPAERKADDLAAILYTSGTTGRSKGAMLSHGNLLSNAQVLKHCWGWRADDVLIHALPIFHVHGLFVASHGALLAGAKMLWFNRFDPRAVIARLPDATLFMGVPTLYVRMLEQATLTREACARMRLFISGSAPLLIETFQAWRDRTGHTILERYGMSETVMLTSNPYRAEDGDRLGGTVGFPLPGVGLRVLDDAGEPCPSTGDGEIGHIQVTGPNVFAGYWRMPEKTREEFTADGWFKTGDVGRRDERGYVTIVGRSKDLIISGGYNVYPAEIEGWLNELPGVAESAVVGVPHPDFGEAVIAVVVPRPGAQVEGAAVIAALKDRIANFKVPKRVFVENELPRNAMGKVQKNLLRERHRGLFV